MKPVAVLSTTVVPIDSTVSIKTVDISTVDLTDVPHYIGHPDTKALAEALGAVPAETKLFSGLQPGESAVCLPIKQGQSSRATEGFTTPHQAVAVEHLDVRIMTCLPVSYQIQHQIQTMTDATVYNYWVTEPTVYTDLHWALQTAEECSQGGTLHRVIKITHEIL